MAWPYRPMTPVQNDRQQFASDNLAGICPEALQSLLDANASGHQPAYGDDVWTQKSTDMLRELFQTDCDVYYVFNGTAANSLALASMCQSYHSVICAPVAHIETDECGGPEFFSNGSKLLVGEDESPAARLGKLTPDAVEHLVTKRRHLKVHMDGARFANAVASLDVHPSEITWRAGVDVLCFGGTKNGLPVGEAVVFFDRELSADFAWRVKQAGQLASKMRFISAPWVGMLDGDTWLRNARHANAMAQRLHQAIHALPGVRVLHPPQANSVFVQLPAAAIARLHAAGWLFYEFIAGGGCRLMCAWDTQPETVDAFAADLAGVCAQAA